MCRSEGAVKLADMQAKKKNNKPHEERGNQEQYKKATPSFNMRRLPLTVIFYNFAEGQVIYNNPKALCACFLHSLAKGVSWRKSSKSTSFRHEYLVLSVRKKQT